MAKLLHKYIALKVTLHVTSSLPSVATDGSENVTGLDLSDFPALADRSRREGTGNPTPVLNPLAGRAPYGRPLGPQRFLIFTRAVGSSFPLGEDKVS